MSFENKTVVVTGAARGIGLSIAQRFHSGGATVAIIDISFPDSFELSGSDRVITFVGDITRSDDVKSFVSEVTTKTGRIDVLVNNAGIIRDNVIWKMPEEDFDKVIEINLKGSWLMCRHIAPVMREQKSGRIVNIASRAWLGNPGQSNYSASKGGLISLTRVLALELANKNITVNAVAPGLIKSPMTDFLPDDVMQKLLDKQPGRTIGQPEDIASAVCYLASDEAGFINGQLLHVDGGRSIGAAV